MSGPFRSYVETQKNNVNVLILGPYRSTGTEKKGEPDPCLTRLEKIRDFLRENGFKQTFLVADFKDENGIPLEVMREHFLTKSQYYIRDWADICIFIFLRDCDNSGVENELVYLVNTVREKTGTSVIIHPKKIVLSGLHWGAIEAFSIKHDPYKKDDEIEHYAYASSFKKLYAILLSRT
jgi:hypothetical protein